MEANNKLIAEFMGVYSKENGYDYTKIGNIGTMYHSSWDWLMPVVDKCYQEHMSKHIADAVMTCDISKAYKAVAEFIKDYNQNN